MFMMEMDERVWIKILPDVNPSDSEEEDSTYEEGDTLDLEKEDHQVA